MKIVRAMKERSRLEGEIKDIKHRMQNCINTLEGNDFPENYNDLFALYLDRLTKLTSIKNAILITNIKKGMFKHILHMGELKSHIEFLKELNPLSGKRVHEYRESTDVYKSQITLKGKLDAIQKTQAEINRITDLLDDFNAKTDIGEVEEVALPLPKIES